MPSGPEQTVDDGAVYTRSELREDLGELVRLVEQIHPEPYAGYDGRVALHAAVDRTARRLPETATREEFYRLVAPLVAGLDDAHSLVLPPDDAGGDEGDDGDDSGDDSGNSPANDSEAAGGSSVAADRHLPLSLRVVDGELYVTAVHDDGLEDWLGCRVLSVCDRPVSDLVDGAASFYGTENATGSLDRLAGLVEAYDPLARLIDRPEPPERPTVVVADGDSERRRDLRPVAAETDSVAELPTTVPTPSGSGPDYRLFHDGAVALFDPGNLSDYRESLEAKYAAAPTAAASQVERAYERQVGGEPPMETEAAIAALPASTATVEELAERMAAAETEALVVDLRDNPGGDSQFVFHLAYALAGREGLARSVERIELVRRRSDPYRERYGDGVGDDESEGSADGEDSRAVAPTEYDFTGVTSDETAGTDPVEIVRARLRRSQTATAFLDRVGEAGLYEPERLVVVTTAGTMSSAFGAAAQLTALGAEVVGVPSGQAPTSFGEPAVRSLPNTGLDVHLAGSMYRWLGPEAPDTLEPTLELRRERFERGDQTGDPALRLAFDHLGYSPPSDG